MKYIRSLFEETYFPIARAKQAETAAAADQAKNSLPGVRPPIVEALQG